MLFVHVDSIEQLLLDLHSFLLQLSSCLLDPILNLLVLCSLIRFILFPDILFLLTDLSVSLLACVLELLSLSPYHIELLLDNPCQITSAHGLSLELL